MARIPLRRFFRHGFLPQIIAFEACVRLGSVTRAAEELSLAQPTVSCMLRKLSETVGGPVTVIRERRIEATAIGLELLTLFHEMSTAMARYEERYHRLAPSSASPIPWPSSSPPRSRSRWKQRASQCPRARRKPTATAGRS